MAIVCGAQLGSYLLELFGILSLDVMAPFVRRPTTLAVWFLLVPFLWAIRPCILRLNERNEEDQVYYIQEGDLYASSISNRPDPGRHRATTGMAGTLIGVLIAYRKLKPEHAKLDAEKQLSNAEAAALVTDKALALLAETEERLHQEIAQLEQDLTKAQARLKEYQATIQEVEVRLEESNNALWLAKQQAVRLQRLVNSLTAQLKEAGIQPRPLDY